MSPAYPLLSSSHPTNPLPFPDLDYTCPFSAKLFHTLYSQIIPLITSLYPNRIHLIFRHQIQPWHPSSTLVHEAALAVERLTKEKAPQKFWDYSRALFEHQKEYFDLNVVGETRNQTYERLARLAEETVGVGREDVMELLRIERKEGDEEGALNIGNQVSFLEWRGGLGNGC